MAVTVANRRDRAASSCEAISSSPPGNFQDIRGEQRHFKDVDDMVKLMMNQMKTIEIERQTREASLHELKMKADEAKEKERRKMEEEREKVRQAEAKKRDAEFMKMLTELESRVEKRFDEWSEGSTSASSAVSSRASRRRRHRGGQMLDFQKECWSHSPPSTPPLLRQMEPKTKDRRREAGADQVLSHWHRVRILSVSP